MIKFFRTIRQRLLKENRISKYLLYAVGEIALVVIGILIALQINTWNEKKKERAEEVYLLNRLVIDLNKDIEQLNNHIKTTEERQKEVLRIIQILDNPKANDLSEFLQLQSALGNDNYFISSRGTYDEGLSSGKLKFIETDSLRELVFEYYRSISNERDNDKLMYKITNEYIVPAFIKEIASTKEVIKMEWNADSDLPNLDLTKLRGNREYYAAVLHATGDSYQIKDWLKYKSIAERLKNSIEQELKNRFP